MTRSTPLGRIPMPLRVEAAHSSGGRDFALVIVVLIASLAIGPANADPVLPGIDIWVTPANGTTSVDFSSTPIPADFFGPGSDPFDGTVQLQGEPLFTVPAGALGGADTVLERQAPADLPVCPSTDTIPVEIKALSITNLSQPQ